MTSTLFSNKYPLLSHYSFDVELAEALAYALANKYSELLLANANTLPKGNLYLDSRLHDSWVTSIDYSGNDLNIWLNDFSTHCFSDAFVEAFKLRIPHRKRVFPVCLRFSGIKSCSISRINRNGKMLPLQVQKYLPRLNELLYDELTCLEEGIVSIGIIFWNHSCDRKKKRLLLQIDCKQLCIEEYQHSAFTKLFGNDRLDIFDAYWKERQKGRNFDFGVAVDFIHGLK